MNKKERQLLQKEFYKLKSHKFNKLLNYPTYFIAIFSLIIFILPTNILTDFPFLLYFTDLMGSIFPNINIYAKESFLNELIMFYLSLMWAVVLITIIFMFFSVSELSKESEKYFGTGKYKNKEQLDHKYLIFIPHFFSFKYFIIISLTILMFGFASYLNFEGLLINHSFRKIEFNDFIDTRFGILVIVNIFQIASIMAVIITIIKAILSTKQIIKIKKGV